MKQKIISALTLILLISTFLGMNTMADEIEGVMPLATYSEYRSKYNICFAGDENFQTSRGCAFAVYKPGSLFNLFKASAFTEIYGDVAYGTQRYTSYAYAQIKNQNDGTESHASSTEWTINRYCCAYPDSIKSTYGTYMKHTARLTFDGTYQWKTDDETEIYN